MQTIPSIVMSFLPVYPWLLLPRMSLPLTLIPQKPPPMKFLVIFKGLLTSKLLQDTFSMAVGIFPLASFFPHLNPGTFLRPNCEPQDRAQLPSHIHSFCPSSSGTLAGENGEGFVYLATPSPFICCPFRTNGSLLLYLEKMGQV